MAQLHFRISVEGLEPGTLSVHHYRGYESLSDSQTDDGDPCYGFRYLIDLASRQWDLDARDFVDRCALLEVLRDNEVVQHVHGIVRRFSRGDVGHHHTRYQLVLVPALERLSLRQNSRIFQLKTVPEIISILLQEMGIEDYAFAVRRECRQREFCVQYRETDLAFLHRLAAEEGLVYSFQHKMDQHLLLFTDDSRSLPELPGSVTHNALSGGHSEQPFINRLSWHLQSEVSHTELRDYSFKQPGYTFAQQAFGREMDYQLDDRYEHYDYPGRHKRDVTGRAYTRIRQEYLRRDARLATGSSDVPALQAGVRFNLSDNLDAEMNRNWVVVQVSHQGTQPQALEEEGTEGATTYANQFRLIPREANWQARPQPQPQVDGPCIAIVVGPDGEEIYCDEHGRVKLHFPWDRYSNGNEHSSCWVRVSQGWAGAQYGSLAIPRIGHEVIVSFLNGDPDQPIVTGRVFHATNQTPYRLPDHKTKTVLRSETHKGRGFNELSFEDRAGEEQIYLHAQKDLNEKILHDQSTQIGHDRHLEVQHDRFSRILGNDHLRVDGERREHVQQDKSLDVEASLHQKVGNNTTLASGREIHLKAGHKVVLEAGSEITLKAGGSFIKIDPAGVHIVGPGIDLNSGGSAGKGSGYGGRRALLPHGVEAPEVPDESVRINIEQQKRALVSAAVKGIPICQICTQEISQ
ncbi:type VI secretion system tip protein VgrG [Marinobacterium maritimum]|uniref:Type VI secretion system tip protein VgrG n=1 Tax=Marinobacterium maritimum TaxID=500162 RepID=A0ABN1I4U5_9GAMM